MSFDLISSITRQPWAIDPQYVQGITPILASLFEHRSLPWPRVESTPPFALAGSNTNRSPIAGAAPGSVAVICMSGPLMKNDQYCGPVGTARIGQWIKEADAAANIDGIILQVDSPGGTVDGTEDLARIIKNTKKPVVAYVDGLAASAAYWIASSADKVIAGGKTSVIGSIGAMMKIADVQPMLEKAGVKFHEVYASKSTDKNKDYRDAVNDSNYTGIINNILDPLNGMFHSAVRTNRRGKLSDEENVFSGKMYFATDAKKHGLVDEIGSMDDAIKSVKALTNTKNKTTMSTSNNYQALRGILTDEQVARIEQLHSQNNQQSTTSHATQQSASELNKTVTQNITPVAGNVAQGETGTAKVVALSEQQQQNRWKNQWGRYSTVQAGSSPAPDTTEEDQKRQREQNKWRNASGRYSTNTLQQAKTDEAKTPSYLDPINPINKRADRHNTGQP